MTNNLTERFIKDLLEIANQDNSGLYNKLAKHCLLDYLGVTLAGAQILKQKGHNLLQFMGPDSGNATVIGFNQKSGILTAAFVNGICAHEAELDDGDRFGMLHPGSPVISALLAISESQKTEWKDIRAGILAGYEAAIRLGQTLQPALKENGYHATGICGTIGAAMGAAVALKMSEQEMTDTLSAASTSASGLLKMIDDSSELKPYNVGSAALNGLLAVSGARAGFGGPYDVLGSTRGLIAVYNEKADVSKLETKPGQPLKIEGIYLKPYAACRHCHPSIEAALKIRDKYQLQHEDIKSVIIKTYKWAVGGHDHVKVYGTNSAKMSIPYSVAVALVTGKAGLEEFLPDRINDIQVQSLTPRVSIYQDDELSSLVPEKRAAIVEIFTINGSKYQERIDYPKGEPENPLSDEEIRDKFLSLAMFAGKSEIEAHTIYENIINDSFELEKITPLIS